MKNVTVADVMTREPITVKPNTSLLECAKKMVRKRIGSLLIVEKGKLLGFISEKDILWALIKKSHKDLSKINAIDISPKKLTTVKPTATIEEAINKMKNKKHDRLPVVEKEELLGFVTVKDILNFHPEFYPELDEIDAIREEQEKLKRIEKAKSDNTGKEGICEECGSRNFLVRSNGMLVCQSCRDSE